jgi:hypothetical protein
MDFAKLGQNEKLALYGSLALIVGGIVGYTYGIGGLGILAALAMLLIIFLPQLSPGTSLPGTHGSLMVAAGGLAGVAMALALLSAFASNILSNLDFRDIFFLLAVVGGLLMAWAGWQEFQSEGGKFQLGTTGAGAATTTPAAPASAPPAAETSSTPSEPVTPATDPAQSTIDSAANTASDAVDEERRPEA